MQFPEGCRLFQFGFHVESTDVDVELYYDDIALSANQFLQVAAQTHPESYSSHKQSGWWLASGGGSYSSGATRRWDTSKLVAGPNTPTYTNSKLLDFSQTKTVNSETANAIIARERIKLTVTCGNDLNLNEAVFIYKGDTSNPIAAHQNRGANDNSTMADISVVLEKGEFVSFRMSGGAYSTGWTSMIATPLTTPSILLNSQEQIFTGWQSYTPTLTGFGSASNTDFWYRRVGDTIEVRGFLTSGTTTSDKAQVSFPAGLSIDFGKINATEARNNYGNSFHMSSDVNYYSNQSGTGGFVVLDYTYPSSMCFSVINVNGTTTQIMQGNQLVNSGDSFMFLAQGIPIAGWNADFNPVLSMPLVDLGQPTETWTVPFTASNNFWDGTGNQWTWNKALLKPYPNGTAGTIANSSLVTVQDQTSGSNTVTSIKASQDIVLSVTVNSWLNSSSYLSIYNSADEWITASQQFNSSNYAGEASAIVNLKAGDYIYFKNEGFNDDGGVTFTAQKVQSGNMAHIIKPAVCIVKNVQAYNQGGGQATSGSWGEIPLNTIEGESWFLSFNSSNYEITLEPGMYKYAASAPFYDTNRTQLMLRNQTDSLVHAPGIPTYTTSYEGVGFNTAQLETTFTITKSTAFSLKYRVETTQATNGLGYPNNIDSGVDSVYGVVKIEKLK
tara:strand:- start:97 stop:2103 length:2007 start_codon:yes stop_codon:yes gene_type:complete